jgi:hypothetical protein
MNISRVMSKGNKARGDHRPGDLYILRSNHDEFEFTVVFVVASSMDPSIVINVTINDAGDIFTQTFDYSMGSAWLAYFARRINHYVMITADAK